MPSHSSTITDITSQLGDPDKVQYEERAKDHFINAISELIRADSFTEEDLHGFVKLSTAVTFASGSEDISSLKALKILEMFMKPGLTGNPTNVTITMKSDEEMRKINSVSIMQPMKDDLFIHKVGNTLYAYVAATSPNFTTGTDKVYMKYIEYPTRSVIDDKSELNDYFSRTFISAAVKIAVDTLRIEDEVLQ